MARITQDELILELKNRGFEGFSPEDLLRYLNWGFRRLCRKANWDFEQRYDQVTLAAGSYTIGTSALTGGLEELTSLMRVFDTTEGDRRLLRPIDDQRFFENWYVKDLDAASSRGTPMWYYWLRGQYLYILPPPSSERKIMVHHWKYLGETVISATFSLPLDWEEAMLMAAEVICHRRARQWEFARDAEAQLEEMMMELIVHQNMTDQDLQERVEAPWRRSRRSYGPVDSNP